jgi:hypothetical protein
MSSKTSRPKRLGAGRGLRGNGKQLTWPVDYDVLPIIHPHPRQLMTMHERNPYKTPPDFESLALAYPPLRPQSVSLFASSDFTHVLTPLHIALSARRKAGCLQSTFTTKRPKGHPKSPMSFDCPVAHICYRRLTQALLYRDFGIQLEIPNDRLCPPVPNR